MSPESFDYKISVKDDSWAFGFLIYQIIERKLPFLDLDHKEIRTEVQTGRLPTFDNIKDPTQQKLVDLALLCWTMDEGDYGKIGNYESRNKRTKDWDQLSI